MRSIDDISQVQTRFAKRAGQFLYPEDDGDKDLLSPRVIYSSNARRR